MAAEPIVIYSHKIDPEGVLARLRDLAPSLRVTGGANHWSKIEIGERVGLFRKPMSLIFTHAEDYYTGADFPNQIRGMQGYFSRFRQNAMTPRIMLLIQSFRFVISLHPPPVPDLLLDSDDPRLKYIFALTRHLDGAIFTPSSLRDASGRVLYHASLDPDPSATMPAIYRQAPPRESMPRYMGGTAPNPPGPTAERVARRALCLAAVSWRAMLEREQGTPEHLEHARIDFLEWVETAGIRSEFEPAEWAMLQESVGKGKSQEFLNAEWKLEGAAVLAWALKRFDLPPFDVQTEVAALGRVLGLASADIARSFIAGAVMRPSDEIETLSTQILGIHWRLREQRLRPAHRDFEHQSQDAWFGTLPLAGINFARGDLAIGGVAINDAPDQVLLPCVLTVEQRHKAINWLCGASEIYSATDTPT